MERTSHATTAVLDVLFDEVSSNKAAISSPQAQVSSLYQLLAQKDTALSELQLKIAEIEKEKEEQAYLRTIADVISDLRGFCTIECGYSSWSQLALLLKTERYTHLSQRPHSGVLSRWLIDNGLSQQVWNALTKFADERNGICHLGRQKNPQEILQVAQQGSPPTKLQRYKGQIALQWLCQKTAGAASHV